MNIQHRKQSALTETGTSMTEMVVFTAIIVGALGGAILFLQESSQERMEKGQAVFRTHELRDPALAQASSSSASPSPGNGGPSDDVLIFVPPVDDPHGDQGALNPTQDEDQAEEETE